MASDAAPPPRPCILIVDGDVAHARALAATLTGHGFEVDCITDFQTAAEAVKGKGFAVVVSDIALPGGLELCRSCRHDSPATGIFIVSNKSEEIDKVLAFELGADDYMTRPVPPREFIARIRSLVRRTGALNGRQSHDPTDLSVGGITVDLLRRRVTRDGNPVDLTVTEFDLLAHLMRHPGRPFTREQLLRSVWGYEFYGYEHTVNSHVNRLRSKIEITPSKPRFVRTVWGVGYKFTDEDVDHTPKDR